MISPSTPDPRRLETVISAKDFVSLYILSSWKRKLITAFLEAMAQGFRTEILLRVPEAARPLHPALFKELPLIQSLRERKLLEHIEYSSNYPDEPFLYRVHAKGRGAGSGSHFSSAERALWSALGECIERSLWFHSSEWYTGKTRTSTYAALSGEKLDLHSIAGFPEEKANETAEFTWIKAVDYTSDKEAWLPLQLLSAEYATKHQRSPSRPHNKEPLLRSAVTTGLATSSQNLEEALLYGTLEAIERDAFMISWLNRLSPPRISLKELRDTDTEMAVALESIERCHLRTELLLLPTDFPYHVVAAVLIDTTGKGPAFTIGAKAHWELKRAALGALAEATSVRHALKRTYTDDIHERYIGRKERLIYWAHPEKLSDIAFLTEGKIVAPPASRAASTAEEWERIRGAMRDKHYRLFGAEISSRASRECGFRSAYIFSPELQPMHLDERAPAFEGKRLHEVPASLGYTPAAAINQEPHPFP